MRRPGRDERQHELLGVLSVESESELRTAGWRPIRQVDPYESLAGLDLSVLVFHPAAEKFLAEYGGLDLGRFVVDPQECLGEEDRFDGWSESIGRSLFPIGILEEGRFFLGIDEHEEVYLIETWVASFGRMPLAMENLLNGSRPVDLAYD